MANSQHSALAKQGTRAIARWREQNYRGRQQLDLSGAFLSRARLINADLVHDNLSRIDLTNADLRLSNLTAANLQGAHLWKSNLSRTNLRSANLMGATLGRTNLSGSCLRSANLQGADLSYADLSGADLEEANLSGADLTETRLSWANLSGANLRNARMTATALDVANLSGADLRGASLVRATLYGSVFSQAVLEMTLFADCDLGHALELDQARHAGPSVIGLDSLARSGGLIPAEFLRQAGVAEALIAVQDRLRICPPACSRVLLVSSNKDGPLAQRIQADLRASGTGCWSLPADTEGASATEEGTFQRVAHYDRVVLVCSSHTLENASARQFFDHALRRSAAGGGSWALVPLASDDGLYTLEDQLCQGLRQRSAIDFRGWQQEETYRQAMACLVAALSTRSAQSPDSESPGTLAGTQDTVPHAG